MKELEQYQQTDAYKNFVARQKALKKGEANNSVLWWMFNHNRLIWYSRAQPTLWIAALGGFASV